MGRFKVHIHDMEKHMAERNDKKAHTQPEGHPADMEKEERTPEDLLADMKAKFASIKSHIPADKLQDEKVQDALRSFKVHLGDLEKEVDKERTVARKSSATHPLVANDEATEE